MRGAGAASRPNVADVSHHVPTSWLITASISTPMASCRATPFRSSFLSFLSSPPPPPPQASLRKSGHLRPYSRALFLPPCPLPKPTTTTLSLALCVCQARLLSTSSLPTAARSRGMLSRGMLALYQRQRGSMPRHLYQRQRGSMPRHLSRGPCASSLGQDARW